MSDIKRVWTLCFAALASACASTTVVSDEDYAVPYDYREFRAQREVAVVIAGAPSPDRVRASLQAGAPRSWPTFVVGDTAVRYRLVLVFDPAPGITAARVCRGETPTMPAVDRRLSVFAVYCRASQPMSQAMGRAPADRMDDLFKDLLPAVFSDSPVVRPIHGYPGGLL
ncbi:MAG TPA: hypothetical protein VMI56_19970 [Reyranella sp.]|nr:hypothetical protein [Reyranella sp.]